MIFLLALFKQLKYIGRKQSNTNDKFQINKNNSKVGHLMGELHYMIEWNLCFVARLTARPIISYPERAQCNLQNTAADFKPARAETWNQ